MGAGIIGYDNPGQDNFPSPAVWADCPNTLLNDKAMGYFLQSSGFGNVNTLPSLPVDADTGTTYVYDGTAVKVGVTATDNNAVALHTQGLATITRGTKIWAEADVSFTALGDEGFFFGLVDKAALTRDVVADDPSNSAQAGLVSNSLIGFVTAQASSKIATIDAVHRNGSATVVTDKSSVATLTAATSVRLGVVYNGRNRVLFFVNGVQVQQVAVDSTFDQTTTLGVAFVLKTGAATAESAEYHFIRAAAQLVNLD